MLGSGEGPWFNLAPSASATPVPTQPPTTQQPLFRSPVTGPAEPQPLAYGLTPYEYGWRQVLLKLLEIIPLLFPGYYPGFQWYATPSAY